MFLDQIMPLLGVAEWRAKTHPLELVELRVGDPSRSAFSLEPDHLKPGAAWGEAVYPGDRRRVQCFFNSSKRGHTGRSIDYRLIVGDGEPLWVRHWLLTRSPAREGRQELHGVLMAIAEQKQLEQECLHMSERECHRIGQELHDDLCQVLTGLTCMTRVLAQRVAKVAPSFIDDIEELRRELWEANNRVRAMAHGLFPAQLKDLTLREALEEFARQTRIRFGVEVETEFSGKLPAHSADQILHVYRIVQEAVGNGVRHGQASVIRLSVAVLTHDIQVRVEDDGPGFPNSAVRPEGIGLHVIRYRARMLGGQVRFQNIAPHGARVELRYPPPSSTSQDETKSTSYYENTDLFS